MIGVKIKFIFLSLAHAPSTVTKIINFYPESKSHEKKMMSMKE